MPKTNNESSRKKSISLSSSSSSSSSSSISKKHIHSELCTLMIIDIVGYTNRTANLSKEEFSKLHDDFDNICKSLFTKYNGSIINKPGDAYLTKYLSASDALNCAIELQLEFQKYSYSKKPLHKIPVRVALHSGDVIKRGNNLFGDTVNTVARIESLTKEGDIVLSESVFKFSNENNIPFKYIGPRIMKGLKYPVKLFYIKKPYHSILNPKQRTFNFLKEITPTTFKILFLFMLMILFFAIIMFSVQMF